jgi:hypothetical protein
VFDQAQSASRSIEFNIDDFINPPIKAQVTTLIMAEHIRLMLPNIKQFRIREEDTIKFVAV